MENLSIEQTKFTPEILFDYSKRVLIIKGESYPENTAEFFKPVFKWIKVYFTSKSSENTIVNVELYYFNSSSSKVLMNLFEELDIAAENGHSITVNWIYDPEDEDSLEFGEEFAEDITNLEFNLSPHPDVSDMTQP